MKKKIYLYLTGGLGNQLFQYACAKNLATNKKADLIIEDKIGFLKDFIFKRKLNLPKNLTYKKIKFTERLIFIALLFIKKIFYKNKLYIKYKKTIIIDETKELGFIKNFFIITNDCTKIYLIGFFQSEKYFPTHKNMIIDKILKNKIKNKKLYTLSKLINYKSLMIGMRFFEEVPNKNKGDFGGIEKIQFFIRSISEINNNFKVKKSYVFTMPYNNTLITQKFKNINHEIINKRNRYTDNNLDNILLISKFKNLIISNSSFYWWGAYLAKKKKKIKIIASKKFKNKDSLPNSWVRK